MVGRVTAGKKCSDRSALAPRKPLKPFLRRNHRSLLGCRTSIPRIRDGQEDMCRLAWNISYSGAFDAEGLEIKSGSSHDLRPIGAVQP